MEENDNRQQREEIFSVVVRAGKRTYFFDVKETRAKEKYLTITESKRRFNNDSAKFFYEKHKLFLYKEDFDKFAEGLNGVIDFIRTGNVPDLSFLENEREYNPPADKPEALDESTKEDSESESLDDFKLDDTVEEKSDDAEGEDDKF